jgi:hypothetical protein
MRKMVSRLAGMLLVFTTLSTLAARAASAPLIFPHYVRGGGYQTTFTFNNLSPASTEVTLDFYSQSGVLTESASVLLPGFGSGTYTLTGTALTIGWGRADFTGAADVAGTETIQMTNGAGRLFAEASFFAAQPDTVLRVPVYEKDGLRTGIAIVNLSSLPSTVSLTLRSNDGTVDDSATTSLDGTQQTSPFVSELFPSLSDFAGGCSRECLRRREYSLPYPSHPRVRNLTFLPTAASHPGLCRRLRGRKARSILRSTHSRELKS